MLVLAQFNDTATNDRAEHKVRVKQSLPAICANSSPRASATFSVVELVEGNVSCSKAETARGRADKCVDITSKRNMRVRRDGEGTINHMFAHKETSLSKLRTVLVAKPGVSKI